MNELLLFFFHLRKQIHQLALHVDGLQRELLTRTVQQSSCHIRQWVFDGFKPLIVQDTLWSYIQTHTQCLFACNTIATIQRSLKNVSKSFQIKVTTSLYFCIVSYVCNRCYLVPHPLRLYSGLDNLRQLKTCRLSWGTLSVQLLLHGNVIN